MLRDHVLPQLRDWFAAHGAGLVAAYLFGSVARGQERPDSDVDIAIVLGRRNGPELPDLDRLADVQSALATQLGRDVDVVPLDGASPDLRHHVLTDACLLLDGDHDARIEFEIKSRNEYEDIAPFLHYYRREVLRRA